MKSCKLLLLLVLVLISSLARAQLFGNNPALKSIIGEIQTLEGDNDPKCYATASRLEDFIYGTPLSDEARFHKNELQKQLIYAVWQRAAEATKKQPANKIVSASDIAAVAPQFLVYQQRADGHWQVQHDAKSLAIHANDMRQYASIAYALRAILAVQQDILVNPQLILPPLQEDAVARLKELVDIYTLASLQLADRSARLLNKYELNADDVQKAWQSLALAPLPSIPQVTVNNQQRSNFQVIREIIAQKVNSYATYNEISNTIFLRNLQVYFARVPWPKDKQHGEQIRSYFTQALVNFASDLYLGAEDIAKHKKHGLIRIDDVNEYAHYFIPHEINNYEDALFFPKLPHEQRIAIESYDMDALRDSGIHWRYLQFALEAPDFQGTLEPDPFAAELLAENIAQFGVLVLRVAGMVAKQQDAKYLHPDHIDQGLRLIQQRITAHGLIKTTPATDITIRSSAATLAASDSTYFNDITAEVGIRVDHRSSDWLNRLLRSYLPSGPNTGNITIPPAFGGAGVAAEDINNDGLPDVLILSGRGNRLYLNNGQGGFRDITAAAGLDWRRSEDNQPGEPRQPLIADLDNDGLQDIVITYVNDSHRVYKNLGNARFADVTEQANLGGVGLVGGPATVFDYDRDGLLDIYITYFGNYLQGALPTLKRRNSNGTENRLFRNLGKMRFVDVTANSGVANNGWAQAVAHTDLDGDGWQDLIVGNDFGVNAYYRNRRDGTFENIALKIGTEKPSYTMNIGLTDLNADNYPDIYISNIVTMNKDEKYVLPTEDTTMKFNPEKLANMRVVEANDLFISQVGEQGLHYTLSDLVGRGYSSTGWSWDADFFDFDNDGDDDLYVLNGMNEFAVYSSDNPYYVDPDGNSYDNTYIPVAAKESNVFFVNQAGRLQNASKQSGVDRLSNSRSAAYLDFDRDGDLDIIVNDYHGPAAFYRNNAEQLQSNWLSVKLVGNPAQGSNLDAIGARILVNTADGNQVWREVHGSIGYMSVHPKEQYIGLGKQQQASIQIYWPNGSTTRFDDLQANKRYVIDQAQATLKLAVYQQ